MFAAKNTKAAGSAAPTNDPNFSAVTLLLHGDGTNGAQNNTFIDSSANNITVTRNGNTTQGSFSPFSRANGYWSNHFPGSSALSASSTALSIGTGDFTIEYWANVSDISANVPYFNLYGTVNETFGITVRYMSSLNALYLFWGDGSTWVQGGVSVGASSTYPVLNKWQHHALVRSSGTMKFYINGVETYSVADTTSFAFINLRIGRYSSEYMKGVLSNFRITKSAVYTAAFTPPVTPLTAITNTAILTCQSSRFIENSANAIALTVTGSPATQPYSPFSPAAAYSTTTNGGSAYFNGTTDYLSIPNNAALQFGTGNFTVEGWMYLTGTDRYQIFYHHAINAFWSEGVTLGTDSGPVFGFWWSNALVISTSIKLNTWYHVALTRVGALHTLYMNGVSVGTYSVTHTYAPTTNVGIGAQAGDGAYKFKGFISNLRVLKGTAAYTANFTPPTAPVTAITNTSLLLNFTNAGIFDNAAQNVLETVGDAKISTVVKKYGTGSISFDGTGDRLTCTGVSASGAYNQLTSSGKINTIEFWLYVNTFVSPRSCLLGSWSADQGWTYDINTSGQIFIATNGAGPTVSISPTVTTGEWQHMAFVNNGTTITIYRNGVAVGSSAVQAPTSYVGPLTVGLRSDNALPLNGYIDDLRITNGVARYTANFTPPTTAFPDQ